MIAQAVAPVAPEVPEDRFERILREMVPTHRAKAHDYGDSLNAVQALGLLPLTGILVRMSDKWSRITVLSRGVAPAVKNESLRDTLLDLAAYAVLAVVEMEKDGLVKVLQGEVK
jgi:hypothetical protein